ncbi:hypothetical protein ACKFRT_02225 [Corynebacterium sp. YSMAA1_1_F7]|uniref:hypothetical protein n=1 Tax=Corynebacterium sp. YSMAA1_1_F7 TaxID=3383590 RepID=UPI0038CFAE7C
MSTANRTWALTGTALALLGLAAGYVAVRWKDIPERFATHFGTRFEPDSGIGAVFRADSRGDTALEALAWLHGGDEP